MSGHFINRCKHGVVQSQCRCPSPNKRVTIVACSPGCEENNEDPLARLPEAMFNAQEKRIEALEKELNGLLYVAGMLCQEDRSKDWLAAMRQQIAQARNVRDYGRKNDD